MQAAGVRNQVINLQRIVRSVDANGVRSESWVTYATLFAEKQNKSDQDTERAGTFGNIGRANWTIPYYPGISTLDRVLYAGRPFNIQGVDDVDELHRDIILTCTEQT